MNRYSIFHIAMLLFCSTMLCAQKKDVIIKEIFDVSYMQTDVPEDTLRRINFYLPQDVTNPPLLIWIGGGAWAFVDRYREAEMAKKFAGAEMAVASIGHRLSSGVFGDPTRTTGIKHPEHIKDVAEAFAYLYKNAAKYGYSQDNIFIGGFSSGAHLSSLLATDEKYLKSKGLSFENIKGIIPVSGGYDISHYHQVFLDSETPQLADQHVKAVFGDTEEDFVDASPSTFYENLNVPMLLFSDGQTYKYTTIFENLLREKTEYTDFEVIHAHKFSHAELYGNLVQEKSLYREMIIDFIFNHVSLSNQ